MPEDDHVSNLLHLSQQLVTAAEIRAQVKARIAALKKAKARSDTAAKLRKLDQEVARISRRIEDLTDQIVQPPRRVERWVGMMPVTLNVQTKGRKFEHPASTVDVSKSGLRVRTATTLSPGQTLDVYFGKGRIGHCRVVWVTGAGSDRPSEVGLAILE